MIEKILTKNLLDLDKTIAKSIFEKHNYPFEVLPVIKDYVLSLGTTLSLDEYIKESDDIWISKSAKVYSNTTIEGPAIIGHNTEIRSSAFIRGNVIIGNNCTIGNSTEIKNAILFDNVQVPHFNYIGDSILGYKSHFGAGVITSNVKSDKSDIVLKLGNEHIATNLHKFGAIIGDNVEIGCNSVLNPGTIVGRNTTVYPLCSVRGYVLENTIMKVLQNQESIEKKINN